jgi:hypothetical protein
MGRCRRGDMKKAWEREDEVAQWEVVCHGLAKSKATVRSDLLTDCPRFSTAARAEEQPAWEKRRTLWGSLLASELHGAKGKTQARNGMHGPSLRLGLVMDRGSFKCPGGHCVLVLAGTLKAIVRGMRMRMPHFPWWSGASSSNELRRRLDNSARCGGRHAFRVSRPVMSPAPCFREDHRHRCSV